MRCGFSFISPVRITWPSFPSIVMVASFTPPLASTRSVLITIFPSRKGSFHSQLTSLIVPVNAWRAFPFRVRVMVVFVISTTAGHPEFPALQISNSESWFWKMLAGVIDHIVHWRHEQLLPAVTQRGSAFSFVHFCAVKTSAIIALYLQCFE